MTAGECVCVGGGGSHPGANKNYSSSEITVLVPQSLSWSPVPGFSHTAKSI